MILGTRTSIGSPKYNLVNMSVPHPEEIVLSVALSHPDAQLPTRAHDWDAGLDLVSVEYAQLPLDEVVMINIGIKLGIPRGYEGQIRPRSGMSKKGIIIPNAPGTVDAGYRGEVKVLLCNVKSPKPIEVSPGDRIAQLVIKPLPLIQVQKVPEDYLSNTDRGEGGFGSSGR